MGHMPIQLRALLNVNTNIQEYDHLFVPEVSCNSDAKRLYDNLLKKNHYNKLIRPVDNTTDTLTVKLGLRLSQIIDVVSAVTLTPSIQFLFNEFMTVVSKVLYCRHRGHIISDEHSQNWYGNNNCNNVLLNKAQWGTIYGRWYIYNSFCI